MNAEKSQAYKNLVVEMQKKYPVYNGKPEIKIPASSINQKGDPVARKIVQDFAATFSDKNDFYDALKEMGVTWQKNSKNDAAIYEMRAKEALRIAVENGFDPFNFVTKNDSPVELFAPFVNGKNICEEINLYTYWQGFGYAKNTPHIKYLLVAQDWGNPFRNPNDCNDFIKMNETGEWIAPYNTIPQGIGTNQNLFRLFQILNRDLSKFNDDVFFTNFCLGYRSGKEVGGMTKKMMLNDTAELKKLCDILEPENILCLGKITFEAVYESLTGQKYSVTGSYNKFLESHENFSVRCGGVESKIFPLAHCGYMGTINRNKNLPKKDDVLYYQIQDWKKIIGEEKILTAPKDFPHHELVDKDSSPKNFILEIIKNMESAINKFDLDENIFVYRRADISLQSYFEEILRWDGFFQDNGFTSTTMLKIGATENKIELVIKVPKGKGRGAYFAPMSDFPEEHEFILNRGTIFKVRSIDKDENENFTVNVEVIGRAIKELD